MKLSGNMAKDIQDFHEKFGLQPSSEDDLHLIPEELLEFRIKFMQEELDEYKEAISNADMEKAFDALIDLVYVAMGTAYLQRFPWMTGWYRVQCANMAKVRAERKEQSLRGTTYDVVKPEGWTPPSHEDLLFRLGQFEFAELIID